MLFSSLRSMKMVTQRTYQIACRNRFTTNTKEVDLTAVQKLKNTTARPSVQSAVCSVLLHAEAYCPVSVSQVTQVECNIFHIARGLILDVLMITILTAALDTIKTKNYCLLCMVQNIHWYGFSLWEPLLYVQQRAQGSWLFTR